jgi:hypothetical protein
MWLDLTRVGSGHESQTAAILVSVLERQPQSNLIKLVVELPKGKILMPRV